MSAETVVVSAERLAQALVRSSRDAGIDPLTVFEPQNEFVRAEAATYFGRFTPGRIAFLTRVLRLRHPDCACLRTGAA